MAEQVGKFLTELPELETPTDGDLMYIVDDETTSKKVTMANLKRALGGNVTGTVEGASVSFSDGADGIPMEECEVTLVPTQDLHGYSKPWAGGAGKNKLPLTVESIKTASDKSTWNNNSITINGITYEIQVDTDGNVLGIKTNGTASGNSNLRIYDGNAEFHGEILNGCPSNGSINTYYMQLSDVSVGSDYDLGNGTIISQTDTGRWILIINIKSGTTVSNLEFKPMIRLSSVVDDTFEPYSNICPISGHTDVTVTVASTSGGSGDDTTVSLGRTVYGGNLDVTTGELEVTWENIASYAGETLTGEWLSSLDEYSTLGTPTTGAQVVYELATPQTYNLTPTQVLTLLGQNYVSHDGGGNIKVVYFRDLDIVINDLIDRVTALENE